jgi:hypothetical protein
MREITPQDVHCTPSVTLFFVWNKERNRVESTKMYEYGYECRNACGDCSIYEPSFVRGDDYPKVRWDREHILVEDKVVI